MSKALEKSKIRTSVYLWLSNDVIIFTQIAQELVKMKVAVFFAAICIFALVMPQAYAEEDESAVREARAAKGVSLLR